MTEIPEHLIRRAAERKDRFVDHRVPEHLIQRANAARLRAAAETGNKFNPSWISQMPQRQDSLEDQLRDLIAVANRLGMYDAADWVKQGMGPWNTPK